MSDYDRGAGLLPARMAWVHNDTGEDIPMLDPLELDGEA